MAEILPEDSGIIRCICEYDHDDNFTIQCERCNAWQHAKCVGIEDEKSVPDNYLCPQCSDKPSPLSKERARALQRRFLAERAEFRRHVKRSAAAEEDSRGEEDRRRRGRKRALETETSDKPSIEAVPSFAPKLFGNVISKSTWSAEAEQFWQQNVDHNEIPRLSNKELKNMPSLKIARHALDPNDNNWQFGVEAGAVVCQSTVPAGKLVCEVIGEIMLKTEYAGEPTNQFRILQCPKPGVVFVPRLPFAIDSRRRGTLNSLFLRRSANPNIRLVTRRDSEGKLRVFVSSKRALKAGVELSLGWHWPSSHPMLHPDPQSEVVKDICWLLGTSIKDSRPAVENENDDTNDTNDTNDENWELTSETTHKDLATPPPSPPPPRSKSRAEELLEQKVHQQSSDENDPGTALSTHVWVPAAQDVAPPPKKRMSLKDYMRKKT